MKDLSYLNKYLLKYKYYYIIGGIFILISTAFAIIPATLIRETFNLIESGFQEYNEGNIDVKEEILGNVLFFAIAIIAAAVFRGLFMYMMRQTMIVASRKIEYDLKNEIFFHYQTQKYLEVKRTFNASNIDELSAVVSAGGTRS